MQNDEHMRSDTATVFDDARRRGPDQSDWAYVDALTEEDLEASIDLEEEGEPDWNRSWVGIPPQHEQRTIRVDGDVIEWFATQGDD